MIHLQRPIVLSQMASIRGYLSLAERLLQNRVLAFEVSGAGTDVGHSQPISESVVWGALDGDIPLDLSPTGRRTERPVDEPIARPVEGEPSLGLAGVKRADELRVDHLQIVGADLVAMQIGIASAR